jgi:subtilisin
MVSGYFSDVIAALQWCVDNGIQVTNNSYGSSGDPGTSVHQAFDNAYAAGVLGVAAAGNSGNRRGIGDNVGYPARYGSVIAVAACDSSDARAYFSSTGPEVELIAPGVNISSTRLGGGYITYSGTSMASPHVTGAAALVWAVEPGLTNDDVRGILASAAEDLGLPASQQGYGLVRADLAVAMVVGTSGGGGGSVSAPGGTVAVDAITYGTRAKNKHLDITPHVVDSNGSSVGGASVSVEIFLDGSIIWSPTGTTGSDGTATFSITNAPSGTYTTLVTDVNASGLTWDGVTPVNSYDKQ